MLRILDYPQSLGAPRRTVDPSRMGAGNLSVFAVADKENGKFPSADGCLRRYVVHREVPLSLYFPQRIDRSRPEENSPQPRAHLEPRVVIGNLAQRAERAFGDYARNVRLNRRGLKGDGRPHGFTQGKQAVDALACI